MANAAPRSVRAAPRAMRGAAVRMTSMRRCIASGEVRPKKELIRFVVGPDGTVVPDVAERLPGRGLWLSPSRDKIEAARTRKLFAKAAKAPARAPEDLADRVERLLVCRCIGVLGLAKRAGQVVCGFEKVAASLATGQAALLIEARDAAAGGRRKMHVTARRRGAHVPVVELLTAEELAQALGEGTRVHVAVGPGALADRLVLEAARLAALRGHADCGNHG